MSTFEIMMNMSLLFKNISYPTRLEEINGNIFENFEINESAVIILRITTRKVLEITVRLLLRRLSFKEAHVTPQIYPVSFIWISTAQPKHQW